MQPEPSTCVKCGGQLAPGAPIGYCARCAFAALFERGTDKGSAALVLDDIPKPGTNVSYIGDYELLEVIAQGGMGVVYKARQKSLNRIVALKLLLGGAHAREDFKRRFRQEAELAAQLQHPNVVPIYEVGEHEGQPFFSMEFVDGPNLGRLTAESALTPELAVEYVTTVAKTMSHAHKLGVLHRDLKPSNILVGSDGRIRISDFGLARQIDGDSSLTLSGEMLGTPGYMPPEQASQEYGCVGPHSDVYSIGAVLYHLLTGRPPLKAASLAEALHQVMEVEPIPPSRINPNTPKDLEVVCLKCLEKQPERRYETAESLAEDLTRWSHNEPVLARAPGTLYRIGKFVSRHKGAASALSTCLLAVVLILSSASFRHWLLPRQGRDASRSSAADLIQRANVCYRRSEYRKAEEILDQIPESELRSDPLEAEIRRQIAWYYAIETNGSAAMANMAKLLRVDHDDNPDLLKQFTIVDRKNYAALLLELGNLDEYRQFREALLNDYQSTTNPVIAACLCKACLLLESDPPSLGRMAGPAAIAGNLELSPVWHRPWAQLSMALFQYRRGDFSSAIAYATAVVNSRQNVGERKAMSRAIMAMALQKTGQGAAATEQLTLGQTAIKSAPSPEVFKSLPADSYYDWLCARILLREAAEFVRLPPKLPIVDLPRWTNSLGMVFVHIPNCPVLFSVWDTRVQDFEAFVKATGYQVLPGAVSLDTDGFKNRGHSWRDPGFPQTASHPVCAVGWNDAKEFCRWLTQTERQQHRIATNAAYRLPEDSEWTLAAGEGTYPWGDEWPPAPGSVNLGGGEVLDSKWPEDRGVIAHYSDPFRTTSPVASFPPNRFGLFDMAGNVRQWVQSSPMGKGSSWIDIYEVNCRSSSGWSYGADFRGTIVGFRCVLDPNSKAQPKNAPQAPRSK